MDADSQDASFRAYALELLANDPVRAHKLLAGILDQFRASAATQPEEGFHFSNTPIAKLLQQVGSSNAGKVPLAFRFSRSVGDLVEIFQWLHDTGVQIGLLGWSEKDKIKASNR
jgi:hypothetical protein